MIAEAAGHLQKAAIDYFRANCYISFDPDDEQVPDVAQCIGSDKLFSASNYPHFDAKFPNSVRPVLDRLDLTDDPESQIPSENPARFCGIASRIAVPARRV